MNKYLVGEGRVLFRFPCTET